MPLRHKEVHAPCCNACLAPLPHRLQALPYRLPQVEPKPLKICLPLHCENPRLVSACALAPWLPLLTLHLAQHHTTSCRAIMSTFLQHPNTLFFLSSFSPSADPEDGGTTPHIGLPLVIISSNSPTLTSLPLQTPEDGGTTPDTACSSNKDTPLPPSPFLSPSADTEDGSSDRGKLLGSLPLKGGTFEQSAEWLEREHKLVWVLKHLKGGREHTLRVGGGEVLTVPPSVCVGCAWSQGACGSTWHTGIGEVQLGGRVRFICAPARNGTCRARAQLTESYWQGSAGGMYQKGSWMCLLPLTTPLTAAL